MNWLKPEPGTPSWRWYVTSECGQWRICKALCDGQPIYTLSHRGVLVMTGSLAECKKRAEAGDE